MGIKSSSPSGPVPADGQTASDPVDFESLNRKYTEEKQRRQRTDALEQYEELEQSSRLAALAEDPFVDHEALNSRPSALVDGQEVQIIILGAGFSGLLHAARLVEAGIQADGIRLVDSAGGFGGTWYWNRFPGLMCDTEASVYCPLLEETGYMPQHKYSYGEELRNHGERIAVHYGFANQGVFRTTIHSAKWNDDTRRWCFEMEQSRGPGSQPVHMTVYSQFFCLCNGPLNHPKVPNIPGLENFQGEMFHTGRWNWGSSGGSPADQTLTGLRGKKVGIIGTGATAVQVVPQLARFAEELYVFQRTPSSINVRGQEATDPDRWASKIANRPGWQLERRETFEMLCQGEPADDQYMDDGWTKLKTYGVYIGSSSEEVMTLDRVQEHINRFLQLDLPFQDSIRRRVDEVVHDREAAETLKPWYPTWCKRPCFHDEFLPTFNLPHVHLVDTSSTKGIRRASSKGLLVGDRESEIELDVLIFATGFRIPSGLRNPGPGASANVDIAGRNGLTMADKWTTQGGATLHGVLSSSFPNLFIAGIIHSANSPNYTSTIDAQAQHTAYILSEALRRANDPRKLSIEVSEEAEEAWIAECRKYSLRASPAAVCTPSYMNGEGEVFKPVPEEEEARRRKMVLYLRGVPAFRKVLGDWKNEGKLDGLILRS